MNIFNRIFTIVGLFVMLSVGAVVLIVPSEALAVMHVAADAGRLMLFPGWDPLPRLLLRISFASVWIVALGALLWLEVRRAPETVLAVARRDGGAIIHIAARSVESRIDDAVDGMPGVIAARARVRPRSKGVVVSVDVRATRETDPVACAAEAAEAVRRIVQNELGLRLAAEPQIQLRTTAGVAKIDRRPSLLERFRRRRTHAEIAPLPAETTPSEDSPQV